MIVLDSSAAVDLILAIGGHRLIAERLNRPGETLHAPHLIDPEVLSALRRLVLRREIGASRAQLALEDFRELRLQRYPHGALLERIWALRSNLSAFDAAYVALAEALDAPLVTADGGLARAPGHTAQVEVFR